MKLVKIENKEDIEITIEVNPGTVIKNNLQMYKDCGVNRLSIDFKVQIIGY